MTSGKAKEIGTLIQRSFDHVSFTEASLQRKDQITTLQSLYSSLANENEKVFISIPTLFLHLIVVVDRMLESEIEDFFSYELLPYPVLFFKDGAMRTATKAKLKNFLLKDVFLSKSLLSTFRSIADGGELLWCCKWKKNNLFGDILQKYVDTARKFGILIVIFDGYTVSTNDCTHQKQTEKS